MNKKELDNFITTDWREEQEELNPNCDFYDYEKDICNVPIYPGNKSIFGTGCLGKICRFWKGKQ